MRQILNVFKTLYMKVFSMLCKSIYCYPFYLTVCQLYRHWMENLITSNPEKEQRVFLFSSLWKHIISWFFIDMSTLKYSISHLVYFSYSYSSLILSSTFQGGHADLCGNWGSFCPLGDCHSHHSLHTLMPIPPGNLLPLQHTLKLLSPSSPVTTLSHFSLSTHLWTLTLFPASFF